MPPDLDHFYFRDLHPDAAIGTASDRYAGWIGQIYSAGRYAGRIAQRAKRVGDKQFTEEVLPVESVEEYFRHFEVLELDFTFYGPLLDQDGNETANCHVLGNYGRHLKPRDRLILKVPQMIFARKRLRGKAFAENEFFLDAEAFTRQFYEPAVALLGGAIEGMIFEQEYQRKGDRLPLDELAALLGAFFSKIPEDDRYHVEIRTEGFLRPPVWEVLERHGVGQVLSHWTWLPPLSRQFALSGGRILNRAKRLLIRLMTPRGMRYEDAYARAHPFSRRVEGMADPSMVPEAVSLMRSAGRAGGKATVIVNNRAGGNAPLIAREIAARFLGQAPGS